MDNYLLGILYTIIFNVINVSIAVIVKKLNMNLIPISFLYTLCMFVPSMLYLWFDYKKHPNKYKKRPDKNNKKLPDNPLLLGFNTELMKISAGDIFRFISKIIAFKILPISIAIPISFSWTFFGLYLDSVYNGEVITKVDYVSMIIAMIGLMIINLKEYILLFKGKATKIPVFTYTSIVLLLLFSSFVRGYTTSALKEYTSTLSTVESIYAESTLSFILMSLVFIVYLLTPTHVIKRFGLDKTPIDIKTLLIYIAYFLVSGYLVSDLSYEALKILPEYMVIALSNLGPILGIIMGWMLFKEPLTKYKIGGGSLIVIATFFMTYKHIK
jgi:drug/metabolite transporter (DMT)-like permease